MARISFADAEYAGKRKKTRREVFLEEMAYRSVPRYSTVTLLARFLGLSTSVPRAHAV